MSNNDNIFVPNTWEEELEYKARLLHEQIASLHAWVEQAGGDDELLETLLSPYHELLVDLYAQEYPLARAVENSDLLFRYQGPAVEVRNPKLSLLSNVFSDVRVQVGRVAKTIAGISEGTQRLPEQMDLNLAALARGSLYVGYALPSTPDPSEVEQAALFENEAFFKATREAVRVLGLVTKRVGAGGTLEEINELLPDPKLRDTVLSAVENIAPSGRQGIQSIQITGSGLEDSGTLNSSVRTRIREWLEDPSKGEEYGSFTGIVREIDLDLRRFELRQTSSDNSHNIRCSYGSDWDDAASDWLDSQVRVYGLIEKDQQGKVRMLHAEQVEFL